MYCKSNVRMKTKLFFSFFFFTKILFSQINFSGDTNSVLNTNADQIGVWINTIDDTDGDGLKNGLKDLKIKNLRYGWQNGVFDKNNLSKQEHSPCDSDNSGYLTYQCRLNEKFGVDKLVDLAKFIGVKAHGVVSIDGIGYKGTQDAAIKNMTAQQKKDFYTNRLVDWINWNKTTGKTFANYEIGNECDVTNSMGDAGVADKWTGTTYGQAARYIAEKAKIADGTIGYGINGGLFDEAGTKKWFDDIYAAAPDLNNYINFVVYHKYEFFVTYDIWNQNPQWEYGRIAPGFLASYNKHFPNKEIHVTEMGSWKDVENFSHYRACLNVEMYGNLFLDSGIKLVQHWPTKWGAGGVFYKDNYNLTPMGLSLKMYSSFAQPRMFANGYSTGVRYFASVNPTTKAITVWFVNHEASSKNVNLDILNFGASTVNEVWKLTAPNNDPYSTATTLTKGGSVNVSLNGNKGSFSIAIAPVSATAVVFQPSGNLSTEKSLYPSDNEIVIYPNPIKGRFKIQGIDTNFSLEIYSASGQIVKILKNQNSQNEINLLDLQSGVYIANINFDNKTIKRKIVIEN
jgi:hypothetical protein